MDKQFILDLDKAVKEGEVDHVAWRLQLAAHESKQEMALITDTINGALLALKDDAVVEACKERYQWMAREFDVERKSLDGRKYTEKSTPWIDRIRETGVRYPKDILHLHRVANIAENLSELNEIGF